MGILDMFKTKKTEIPDLIPRNPTIDRSAIEARLKARELLAKKEPSDTSSSNNNNAVSVQSVRVQLDNSQKKQVPPKLSPKDQFERAVNRAVFSVFKIGLFHYSRSNFFFNDL